MRRRRRNQVVKTCVALHIFNHFQRRQKNFEDGWTVFKMNLLATGRWEPNEEKKVKALLLSHSLSAHVQLTNYYYKTLILTTSTINWLPMDSIYGWKSAFTWFIKSDFQLVKAIFRTYARYRSRADINLNEQFNYSSSSRSPIRHSKCAFLWLQKSKQRLLFYFKVKSRVVLPS